jgi:hypothetical protein
MQHSTSDAEISRGAVPLRKDGAESPHKGALIYDRPVAKKSRLPLLLMVLVAMAILLFFVFRWLA